MNNLEKFMGVAIREARKSLQKGNSGFGAVIIRNGVLTSKAHDTDKTSKDPTAHAEIEAIRIASRRVNGDFDNCMLVSTHEPCPMCATAIVWAGIKRVAFGYSIRDSLTQGRTRIDLSCKDLFRRAGASIDIIGDVKKAECSLLYNDQVRKSIKQLRGADSVMLSQLAKKLSDKRIRWFRHQEMQPVTEDPLYAAYQLFLKKLGLKADEAPIVDKQKSRLVIHSKNFCPTLEACKILDLDTRVICKQISEGPTRDLLRQLNPNLNFARNYDCLRPYEPYCEEMIILDGPFAKEPRHENEQ